MSKVEIRYDTPPGTVLYRAELLFDDGDYPNADGETVGHYTEEQEAVDAMRAALALKPENFASTVVLGNMAGWCGVVERGTMTKDDDADWFMEPDFERDEGYEMTVYRSEVA